MSLPISLQPEYVAQLFGWRISNSLLTSVLVTLILTVLALVIRRRERLHRFGQTRSVLVRAGRNLLYQALKMTRSVVGDHDRARAALPLVLTFFIFITAANLLALVPGFLGSFYVLAGGEELPILRSPNSDLNTTLALALISVLATQWFSAKAIGGRSYLKRFFDLRGPIRFVMGFFELLSESVRVLSFSFRLFGNVFAGEVLLLVIAFLVPYFVPVPFMVLEVFVGMIQAFIFAALTLSFIRVDSVADRFDTGGQLQQQQ
jgi:F-type H+-transporting ATPase subunit a